MATTTTMIGRERELEELGAVAALRTVENERGERIREEPAPLVVVYGGASTGKSMCVAQALRRHGDIYALVDCTAIYSAQEFYREILVQLYKNQSRSMRGASPVAAADEGATGVDTEEQVTIEDEQEITDAAQAGAKKTDGTGGGDGSDASSHSGGESESESSDSEENDQDEKSAWQSRKQNAVSRAKREREQQREQQQQRDTEARESRVTYEGYNSLNFLSFIKALGIFMDVAVKQQQQEDDESGDEELDNRYGQQQRKRVVYLALDQVDKLLDRGFAPLLTCIFTVNDQLAYLDMFSDVEWDVSVLLITRAMSLEFDHLVSAFFPAYIAFSPYTNEQVADILVDQLRMQPVARTFRKWLLHLSTLVPASQDDWLEFRRNVVHLLPDFKAYFTLVTTATNSSNTAPALPSSAPLLAKDAVQKAADKQMKKLMRETNTRVGTFQKTRRKHLFGHDKLERSGGDPTDTITCTDLSRSCLLLIIAGFLASFNPQDTDTNFLSSSGGVRRKKRVKKTGQSSAAAAEQISQLLIGPRIFTLQRLLAIYLNLRAEASADLSDRFIVNEAREDIFTHLATLVRMQLFQRTSPPNMLDDIKFRCLADSRFVQETARYLRFPLESYLNTAT